MKYTFTYFAGFFFFFFFLFFVRQHDRLCVSDHCAKHIKSVFVTRNGYIDFIECFKSNVLYLKINTTKN